MPPKDPPKPEIQRLRDRDVKRGEVKRRARARPEDGEHLWERVKTWRERLETWSNRPVIASLAQAWAVLDEHYGDLIKRADAERVATTPAEALFFYIEMGFYPPPEILLAVADAYGAYIQGGGSVTLEEMFFGKPRRKGGPLARRRLTRSRYMHWGIWIRGLMDDEGLSMIEAAERVSSEIGGRPEAESIIRLVKNNYPHTLAWSIGRKKKAG